MIDTRWALGLGSGVLAMIGAYLVGISSETSLTFGAVVYYGTWNMLIQIDQEDKRGYPCARKRP